MKTKRLRLAIFLLILLILIPLIILFSKEQVIKESIQVQILENLFKPLDLIFIHYAFLPNKLPKYEITTSQTDLQKLYDSLPKTKVETEFNYKRIVENRIYIPIKFKLEDRLYNARMTVRGVNPPHYLGEKKSLRVRIDPDQNAPFSGIDFLVPEDRYFVDDIVSYYISERLNLFALKPGFVNVKINEKNMGVYETLPDEEDNANIELSKFSASDIFYRDESKPQVLASHPQDSSRWANLFKEGGTWQVRNKPEDNDPYKFSALGKLIEINELDGNEFFSELSKITETDQLIRFMAHNYVMGDWHQGNQHNQSLIFLKEIGKFWFIPNDNSINPIEVLQGFHFNDFAEKILKNPAYYWARNKILWELVNDEEFKKGLRSEIDKTYDVLKGPIYTDSLKPFRFLAFRSKIKDQKEIMLSNFEKVKSYFKEYYIDTSTKNFSGLKPDMLATTRVRTNSYFQPSLKSVKLFFNSPATTQIGIYYDVNANEKIDPNDEQIVISNIAGASEYDIETDKPLKASHFLDSPVDIIRPTAISNIVITSSSDQISLKNIEYSFANSLTGEKLEVQNNLLDGSFFLQKPSLPDFVEVDESDNFKIGPGTKRVTQDLYFPKGKLTIHPGTTLLFDPNVSLISEATITAIGTSENPITFSKSHTDNWGGVLVIGPNNDTNVFENVAVEYGSGVSKYGFKSTGTISIHFSNAKITNSNFSQSSNDDALNVKHGNVEINNNHFENTYSDAIDIDAATGEILDNSFENIGVSKDLGDAIDTSFANVLIRGNRITNASDKCLSLGEDSKPQVIDNFLENCGIAIAVKDGSEAQISQNTIKRSKIGISAYMKKSIYKKGGIAHLVNNQFEDNQKDKETDKYSKIIE